MFARSLIVLLVVLNLGVAGWWALRVPFAPPAAPEPPAEVPRLRLAGEPAPDATVTVAPAVAPAPAVLPGNAVCHSFGPFADRAAVQSARAALGAGVLRSLVRERASGRVRGWRVIVPPLPTREQAVALAARIEAAGFTDYFVMREGADTNAVALGRFGAEDSARRREAELVAAGFPARAEAVGGGPSRFWLDVAAAPGFDAAGAQARIAAGERRALDCATLAPAPAALE